MNDRVVSGDAVGGAACAGLGSRLAARLIDTVAMGLSGAAGFVASTFTFVLPLLGSDGGAALAVGGSMAVTVLCAASYEPLSFARWGTTFGKQMVSVAAVGHLSSGGDGGGVSRGACWVRWGLPHGAFAAAAATVALVVGPDGWWLAAGAGVAAWTAVYGSALLDPQGRGWHDRAAGTVVVAVPFGQSGGPSVAGADSVASVADNETVSPMRPGMLGAVAAVLVVAVSLGAGTVASAVAWGLQAVFGGELDLYDEQVRAANERLWREGPDGDACWYDGDGRVYFCDLVSVGGVRFDTGDLGTAERPGLHLGSGYMCLLNDRGTPRCWEWGPGVQPRPARAPRGVVFDRFRGGEGFVCAQTADYRQVVCWTIGVDQPEYRQATHRRPDDSEWIMGWVYDDPPGFSADPRGPGFGDRFGAFTGRDLNGDPRAPGPWMTQTVP